MSTKRKAGNAVAAVVILSAAFSACDNAVASTGSPVAGGTQTYAINTDADCLDPHQSPVDVAGFFARPVLDSLVSLDAAGRIYPWLASAWTISADQRAYTFTLRTGVTISNGETTPSG
jgi:peptide/nickel transport system substrate-binding protein